MTEHVMHFVGPDGDVIALGHIVPYEGQLQYGMNHEALQPLMFTPLHGELHRDPHNIEVKYLIWKSEDDKTERNDSNAELLVHHNGTITFRGVEYHIDKSRRPHADA